MRASGSSRHRAGWPGLVKGAGSVATWTKRGSWRQLWQSVSGVAQEGVSSGQRDHPICSVDVLGWGHSGPSILTFIGSDHVSTREDHPVRWGGQMLSYCEVSNLMRGASAPEKRSLLLQKVLWKEGLKVVLSERQPCRLDFEGGLGAQEERLSEGSDLWAGCGETPAR